MPISESEVGSVLDERLRSLEHIALFKGIPAAELKEIAGMVKSRRASAGDYIIQTGEPGHSVFFITGGSVQILANTLRTEYAINCLRTGDFFGEMAVLDRLPRSASVRALADTDLLELQKDDFHSLFGKYPQIARIILERISLRMRQTMADLEFQLDALQRANEELLTTYDCTLQALSRALDLRDADTEDHSQRVADLACRLGARIGLTPKKIAVIRQGAMLHDVGKIGVPDAVLRKPGSLDDDERDLIRNHPRWGYDMLKGVPFLENVLPLILYHHEKFDGSGYPEGLSGEAIPIEARIFAIVDAYDAMTSDRPYRKRMTMDAAFEELDRCAGAHFDPALVREFKAILR